MRKRASTPWLDWKIIYYCDYDIAFCLHILTSMAWACLKSKTLFICDKYTYNAIWSLQFDCLFQSAVGLLLDCLRTYPTLVILDKYIYRLQSSLKIKVITFLDTHCQTEYPLTLITSPVSSWTWCMCINSQLLQKNLMLDLQIYNCRTILPAINMR